MPDTDTLWLYVVAALILAATPGPAVIYIVTRSVSQGRAAGLASCLGLALGGMVHVLAAVLGLSALLAASALAFNVVKYTGAAYLVWLGIQRLTQAAGSDLAPRVEAHSLARVFSEGVVVNLLNPKAALFFLAFLPQFVVPSRGQLPLQVAILGGLFLLVALCTDAIWSLAASSAGGWLRRHPAFMSSERYVVGSVYVGLGLAAAASGGGRK